MHPIKYIWGIRAIVYKLFFKHIGKFTYIGKPCFVEGCKNMIIGNRVRIFPGLRIQTLEKGKIVIGNNTAIEQNVHITSAREILYIGNDVTILGNSFITNIDHEYKNIDVSVLDQGIITKETKINDGCFIGFGASIQAGTKLGKHCIVGTNAVVRGEYTDYCVIAGNPGRIIKKYNTQTKIWEKYNE